MNLIEIYKKKKASGEFLNPTSEIAFIEASIQALSEIMTDEKNTPQSMAYRKAHEAHTYFAYLLNQVQADLRRVYRMNELRAKQNQYWKANSEKIATYRKQLRDFTNHNKK